MVSCVSERSIFVGGEARRCARLGTSGALFALKVTDVLWVACSPNFVQKARACTDGTEGEEGGTMVSRVHRRLMCAGIRRRTLHLGGGGEGTHVHVTSHKHLGLRASINGDVLSHTLMVPCSPVSRTSGPHMCDHQRS